MIKKEEDDMEFIKNEIHALKNFDCDFIIKLYKIFQDDEYVYLVLEYVDGSELFEILCKKRRLDLQYVKYILAQLILALEHIHEKGYIHRDIKSENILISKDGSIKLCDFGFSKKINSHQKTYSFVGTLDYLSPEIISKSGHNKMVDLWELGILTYELLVGIPPFHDKKGEEATMNNILKNQVDYPMFLDDYAKEFIMGLLERNPNYRMTLYECKNHRLFKDINWNKVKSKEMNFQVPERKMIQIFSYEEIHIVFKNVYYVEEF